MFINSALYTNNEIYSNTVFVLLFVNINDNNGVAKSKEGEIGHGGSFLFEVFPQCSSPRPLWSPLKHFCYPSSVYVDPLPCLADSSCRYLRRDGDGGRLHCPLPTNYSVDQRIHRRRSAPRCVASYRVMYEKSIETEPCKREPLRTA